MPAIKLSSRDAIIVAAFRLFNENPSASLADIAERAGVGRATLHRHFASRDELMIELAKSAIKELDAAVDRAAAHAQSYTQALKLSMEAIVPLADRQWFLYRETVEDHPEIHTQLQRQANELADAVSQARKEGSFDPDVPTEWIVKAFDMLTFAAWELVRGGELTPKQAGELAWRNLTTGLGVVADE
ncbi:MAG: TetR/AcrR family transcriptional regulator [Gammaproteobacteria bacterium]|nr:TetR/AcrR family transcriptional regulator [Gammaproteobacteria bacterium]